MGNKLIVIFYTEDSQLVPRKFTKNSIGYDLHSASDYHIQPGQRCKIRTGVQMQLHGRWFGQLYSRSGLALKGLTVQAGVIDKDYTGELFVLLYNTDDKITHTINKYDRIAQIVFHKQPKKIKILCKHCKYIVASNKTGLRNNKGFGSTGT